MVGNIKCNNIEKIKVVKLIASICIRLRLSFKIF